MYTRQDSSHKVSSHVPLETKVGEEGRERQREKKRERGERKGHFIQVSATPVHIPVSDELIRLEMPCSVWSSNKL